MQSAKLPKMLPFSYPVYLLSQTQIAVVKNEKELRHFEAWILYDETRRRTEGDLRPFDANFVRLAHRTLPFRGGAFDLYIDTTRDHSRDAAAMKSLLVSMLVFANEPDEEDGGVGQLSAGLESAPVDYAQYEISQLLPMALRQCATM